MGAALSWIGLITLVVGGIAIWIVYAQTRDDDASTQKNAVTVATWAVTIGILIIFLAVIFRKR